MIRWLSPRDNLQAGLEILRLLRRHQALLFEVARRDVRQQYSGQALGALWAIAHPLFVTGLYVFVFAFVFRLRLDSGAGTPGDYTAYILSGLVPWLTFQQILTRSCTAISSQANLVKQVVFPVETLPVSAVMLTFVPLLTGSAVLAGYLLVRGGGLQWMWLLLPLLMACQFLAAAGVAFLLGSIGVFFRDAKDVMAVAATAGVYVAPVVYVPEWVPDAAQPLLFLNPFSYPIWCYQDALYFGRFEHAYAWVVFPLLSIATFVLGYRVFRRLKSMFGNVV